MQGFLLPAAQSISLAMSTMLSPHHRAGRLLCAVSLVALALSGCAVSRPSLPHAGNASEVLSAANHWHGRIALKVDQDPPQSFIAGFELQGTPEQGSLSLTSPLGNTVGRISWTAQQALLELGGHTRSYASLDTLVTDMTGTNIPIAALFDWLHGQSTPVQGWIPDLSRAREGRLSALRQQPLPTAHLHVILDQAQPTP